MEPIFAAEFVPFFIPGKNSIFSRKGPFLSFGCSEKKSTDTEIHRLV